MKDIMDYDEDGEQSKFRCMSCGGKMAYGGLVDGMDEDEEAADTLEFPTPSRRVKQLGDVGPFLQQLKTLRSSRR